MLIITAEITKANIHLKCINRYPEVCRNARIIFPGETVSIGDIKPGSVKKTTYSTNIISDLKDFTIHITGEIKGSVVEGVPYRANIIKNENAPSMKTSQDELETEPQEVLADISIVKYCTDEILQAGKNVHFIIIIRNNGPNDATGIVVTDIADNEFISGIVCDDPSFSNGLWMIDSLACGEEKAVSYTALLEKSGRCITCAVASSNETDPNTENNSSVVYMKISPDIS
jgi:uncharacterized repeat protein (TIGR01451 family)